MAKQGINAGISVMEIMPAQLNFAGCGLLPYSICKAIKDPSMTRGV